MAHTLALLAASLAVFVVGHQAALEDFLVVGPINGKTFYIPKKNTLMHWFEADHLCYESDLKLATFKDNKEFQFVRASSNLPANIKKLWVGGKLKGQQGDEPLSGFEWQDGTEIFQSSFYQTLEKSLCLIFSKDDDLLQTELCKSGQYKPLCQSS